MIKITHEFDFIAYLVGRKSEASLLLLSDNPAIRKRGSLDILRYEKMIREMKRYEKEDVSIQRVD